MHALDNATRRPALQARQQADICCDGEVWEQSDFLNHISDATAQPRDVLRDRVVATHAHDTSSGREEPIDQPECRALSRTAAAKKDERLAGGHGKRDVVDERSAL